MATWDRQSLCQEDDRLEAYPTMTGWKPIVRCPLAVRRGAGYIGAFGFPHDIHSPVKGMIS